MASKALIAGVGDFPDLEESEEQQADGVVQFGPLSSVEKAVRAVASALHRTGVHTGGDPLLEVDRGTFLDRWRGLRQGPVREEPLIVHFAGHGTRGTNGGLYLAPTGADARAEFLDDTCISFDQLLSAAENGTRPVLFLLDVCGAGQAIVQQQLQDLAARRAQGMVRTAWIIGACINDADTYAARFSAATAAILHQLADGTLDLTPALEYVPVDTFAAAIDRELARADRAAGFPGQTIVRTPHVEVCAEPQPFLPNPAHRRAPHAALLDGMDPRLREFAHACSPGLDPLHFATRAAGNPNADIIQFSGRTSALGRIQRWISADRASREPLLVVTGGPGSGKSALLGVTACLTHSQLAPLRPRVRNAVRAFRAVPAGRVLAVHARQLTLQQIADSLRHQLNGQPARRGGIPRSEGSRSQTGMAQLLDELRGGGETVVILDALDEALDPGAVVDSLLLPLIEAYTRSASGPRVMIGTRPWWDVFPELHAYTVQNSGSVLNLDPVTDHDRSVLADDLHAYLDLILDTRSPAHHIRYVADRIANYTDSGAFLVAALYADHLLTTAADDTVPPPCSITEVFDLHRTTLARAEPWIEPVLAVLGRAQGQGMPLDLIHTTALAQCPPTSSQPTPQLTDTRRALTKVAFYLRTTPDSEQRLLYRYFHQALTDHTAPLTDPAALHSALLSTVPTIAGGHRDWEHAHPYLLRYAAAHATVAGNGALDELLQDPGYLVHADPDNLAARLHHAAAEPAVLCAHIYRTTSAYHPDRGHMAVRRSLLALDASSWRQPELARALAVIPLGNRPASATPQWATRLAAHPARRHTLTGVSALTTGVLPDGTPIGITLGDSESPVVWDLTTGIRRHTLTGHNYPVRKVTYAVLPDGTHTAITSSNETTILWDLTTGTRRYTLTGHKGLMNSIVTAILTEGTLIAVSTSNDGTATLWNLTTGTRRYTLTGHKGQVNSIVTATLTEGTLIAVSTSNDGTATLWNLTTGTGHALSQDKGWKNASFEVTLPGIPVAVFPPRHRSPISEGSAIHAGHLPYVRLRAAAVLPDGSDIAVTFRSETSFFAWDAIPRTRQHTLTEYVGAVNAAVTTILPDGTRLSITASNETSIVWNLTTDTPHHTLTGHTDLVTAVAAVTQPDGTPLAVTTGADDTAIVWDLTTDTRHLPLTGHKRTVRAAACAVLPDGTHVAVTVGDDKNSFVWNLATGAAGHTLNGHKGAVTAVITAALPDGTAIAVTTSNDKTAIVWDLATDTPRHTLTGHTRMVRSVAYAILPDGPPVAVTTSNDKTAIVWDLVSGARRHTLTGHKGWVNTIVTAILPDGTPVAVTASNDKTAIVWDLATGARRHTFTGHTRMVRKVAYAVLPDGTPVAVTTSNDKTTIVWDLVSGARRHTLTGHIGRVTSIVTAILPDRTPIAITTSHSGDPIVWDLTTGAGYALTGHTDQVTAVTTGTLPDGTFVAITTSHDRSAIVWELATGRQVWSCQLPDAGQSLTATHAGFLISYGPDVACFVWNERL
ncbi:AAA family ATPase [Streptomyces sp. NPDC002845]